jgi:hypothetical protein
MSGHLLDDAQRAALAPHALEWALRALSTEPVDWLRWEAGVRRCYDYLALRWPGTVVRTASPLALARALFLARVNETPGDEDRAVVGMVRQQLQFRVDRVLSKRFGRNVIADVRQSVAAPVEAALGGDAVVLAVDDALHAAPLSNDPAPTQESARAAAHRLARTRTKLTRANRTPADWQSWRLHLAGHWESGWSAYATFFVAASRDEHGKGWQGRVRALVEAQSAGWWWPHTDFVLVCDRPQLVRTEEVAGGERRLHCSDGPAVVWWDGWSLYFWHGTRVPPWVVQAPSVDAIHAEPNVEVRRCGIEALGWNAYLTGAGLRLVDTADDPGNPGFELRLYDVPAEVWGTPARVLLATNGSPERDGTRRRYGLPVPPDMDTALHAAAWTYGLSREQYAGLARRA